MLQLWCFLDGSVTATDARLMIASWRPTFLYHYRWTARGPIGSGAAIMSADWIALVLVSRELGCKQYINIGAGAAIVSADGIVLVSREPGCKR